MAEQKDMAGSEAGPEDSGLTEGLEQAREAAGGNGAANAGAQTEAGNGGTPQETAAEAGEPDPDAASSEELEAEIAELKDQLLRAVAETENVRRRAQRDRDQALKFAAKPVLEDILVVADNLERALSSIPEEAAEADENLGNLRTGVEMTARALQSVLTRHKVERMEPLGEQFDPHLHNAMFEVPDPSQPAGTIVQIMEVGYRLHDRLLRAASVGVAKGGPPPAQHDGETAEPGSTPGSTIDTEV